MRKEASTIKNWYLSFKKQEGTHFDLLLILTVLGLMSFGLIMVYSSSFIYALEKTKDGYWFVKKQIAFALFGLFGLAIFARIPYVFWKKCGYPALFFAIFLLGCVFVPGLGAKAGGARRWIRLGSFHFQPGELAKFAVLLFVCCQLSKKIDRLHSFAAGMLSPFLLPGVVLLLLLKQPDFGTTAMIAISTFFLIFLAGIPFRHIFFTGLGFLALAVFVVAQASYRKARFFTFLDPWADPSGKGFQIIQSFIGFHHGKLWGVGLGNGKEKLFFLPEAHNDFICTVIAEEHGFVGLSLLVFAYSFLLLRGMKIASVRLAHQDQFGFLLAAGITLALVFQFFVNLCVVLGLVPTKGLTAPFLSYGGSALIIDCLAVGVLLNIGRAQYEE
jgi:cell division protein FtsW